MKAAFIEYIRFFGKSGCIWQQQTGCQPGTVRRRAQIGGRANFSPLENKAQGRTGV